MEDITNAPAETPLVEAPPGSMEARLQYLEAQNEGLKRVGILGLALVLIIGGLFVFQVWNDLKGIATGGIVLHDESKNGRMAMTVSPQGGMALVPINQLGSAPKLEATEGEYSGLQIYDSEGRLRIIFGITPDDQPIVGIIGKDKKVVWSPTGPAPNPQATPKPSPAKASPSPAPMTPTPTP